MVRDQNDEQVRRQVVAFCRPHSDPRFRQLNAVKHKNTTPFPDRTQRGPRPRTEGRKRRAAVHILSHDVVAKQRRVSPSLPPGAAPHWVSQPRLPPGFRGRDGGEGVRLEPSRLLCHNTARGKTAAGRTGRWDHRTGRWTWDHDERGKGVTELVHEGEGNTSQDFVEGGCSSGAVMCTDQRPVSQTTCRPHRSLFRAGNWHPTPKNFPPRHKTASLRFFCPFLHCNK